MKKRMQSYLLVLLLVFTMVGAGTSAAADNNQNNIVAEMRMHSIMQEHAVRANDKIVDSFSWGKDGMCIYPDDFAGTYVDGQILKVYVKDLNENSEEYYISLVEDEAKYVQLISVPYSRNELQAVVDEIAKELIQMNIPVFSYCVDVVNNGIRLTSNHESVSEIKWIAQNRCPHIAVNVVGQDNPPQTTTTYIYGGDTIVNLSYSTTPFTLGVCGIYAGYGAFVTAGHTCTALNQDIKYNNSTGAVFGNVKFRMFPLNSTYSTIGDYAICWVVNNSFETTAMWKTTSSLFSAIDGSSSPTGGTEVCRYGRVTGMGTGNVSYTNVTVVYDSNTTNPRTVTGMTEVVTTYNGAKNGDSGGPYVRLTNYEDLWCGIQSGGIKNSQGVCTTMYFTPQALICNSTGFVVNTGE